MRTLPIAGLALLLAAATPATATTDDSQHSGGCRVSMATDPTWVVGDPYEYHGVVWPTVVLYSPSEPTRPVSGTLTCFVSVNGVVVASPSFTGTGVVAGAEPFDLVADEDDYIGLCETMDYADDTPDQSICYAAIPWAFPPEEVWDFRDAVVDLAPAARDAACSVTPSAPDVGTLLRSGDDGDLRVNGSPAYDCPPRD